MDYMAILGCNCLLKRRIHAGRLFAVSLIFSLFHLFLVCFIRNRILYLLIAHFVLNTGMVFLCFGWEGKRSYLENWVVTYFMCVIQGGALEWLLEQQIFTQNEVLQIFVVTAAVVTAVICFGERRIYGNHIYPAELKKGERHIRLHAYWDSGNQLMDPYTGQEISILSETTAEKIFSKEKDLVRFVPYRSLGEKNGLIAVTNVDEMIIFQGKHAVKIQNAAIGTADKMLFDGKEYEMILNASSIMPHGI
ncbi:sigma-E processing peptidase SpoIIGA [Roseburia rectibacter]|jgi:sigma-E processing peptidase SpoIIGA|nr:sigma-E processing peptidase SpoIIGA [Roseburia rectibacter]